MLPLKLSGDPQHPLARRSAQSGENVGTRLSGLHGLTGSRYYVLGAEVAALIQKTPSPPWDPTMVFWMLKFSVTQEELR